MLVYYISGLIYCRSSGGFLNHLDFIAMFRSSQKTHKNVRPMSIQIFFIFHAFCIAMVTLNIWEIIQIKSVMPLNLLENYRNMCMGLCYTLVMHCTVLWNNATNQQLIRCMCSKENSALGFHIEVAGCCIRKEWCWIINVYIIYSITAQWCLFGHCVRNRNVHGTSCQ